ncbi:acyl-CoA dehydrogenase, partial [Streptomyces sp. SID4948]|uniref:acyl-CoA dehydrogenase family protein n=1 Tax=Streptomyces sp. SID4948 TaxID=2690287 RepID=UPI001371C268
AVYRDGRPERGVDPGRLRAALGALDGRGSGGAVLSACVQLATVLPLLAEAGRSGAGPAAEAAGRMLDGRSVIALAATDAGSGSDLTALDTEVRDADGGLVVTGTKRWITNALHADLLLVLARRRPGPHFTNFSWLLVPADAPGVHIEAAGAAHFAGAGTGHIRLDAVRLAPDAVVGGAGRGLPLFARHIAVERLAGGMWAAALCRRALADTLAWLTARGLWDNPVIRQRFADALVRTHQLDALVTAMGPGIAERHDHGAAAVVKAAAGTTADHVLDACAHLLGAEGFTAGGMQERRLEAALFGIAGGATEVVRAGVADHAAALLAALAPERDR